MSVYSLLIILSTLSCIVFLNSYKPRAEPRERQRSSNSDPLRQPANGLNPNARP